jgi:hypothetical protein
LAVVELHCHQLAIAHRHPLLLAGWLLHAFSIRPLHITRRD